MKYQLPTTNINHDIVQTCYLTKFIILNINLEYLQIMEYERKSKKKTKPTACFIIVKLSRMTVD